MNKKPLVIMPCLDMMNGRVVKASYEVKVGDKIEITMGPRTVAVEVLQVVEVVKKDDAAAMYKEV